MNTIQKSEDIRKMQMYARNLAETYDRHKKDYPYIELTPYLKTSILLNTMAAPAIMCKTAQEPVMDLMLYAIILSMQLCGDDIDKLKIACGTDGTVFGDSYVTGQTYLDKMDKKYTQSTIDYYVGVIKEGDEHKVLPLKEISHDI